MVRLPHRLYKGLLPLLKIQLGIRLITVFIGFSFLLGLIISPLYSKAVYISRIDCAHLDVAEGLYNSLRKSVSSTNTPNDLGTNPIDTSLTNSEITLLSKYAQAQVSNAPQFIITLLYNWCYGNYNSTVTATSDLICSKGTKFNFKQELKDVGLTAILAYAYESSTYIDSEYNALAAKRNSRFDISWLAMIFACVSQFAVLIYTLVVYSNRKNFGELSTLPNIVIHVLGLLSVASCTSLIISSSLMTNLVLSVQDDISYGLGSFGIDLHLGLLWFGLLWTATASSIINMLSWILPLWCNNPEFDYDHESKYYQHQWEEEDQYFKKDTHPPMQRFMTNHFEEAQEEELRKLGKNLAKKPTIRHILKQDKENGTNIESEEDDVKNRDSYMCREEQRKLNQLARKPTIRRQPDVDIDKDEVQFLLYDNNQYSNYPVLQSRKRSTTLDMINQSYSKSRNLSNPSSRKNSKKEKKNVESADYSILDDDELEILRTAL